MSKPTITNDVVSCDICQKEYKGNLGLSIHKSRIHGITPNGHAESNGLAVATKTKKGMQKEENISGLAQLLFPSGIPASKIEAFMEWIDQTRRLIR